MILTTLICCTSFNNSTYHHGAIFILYSSSKWFSCFVYSHNLHIVVFHMREFIRRLLRFLLILGFGCIHFLFFFLARQSFSESESIMRHQKTLKWRNFQNTVKSNPETRHICLLSSTIGIDTRTIFSTDQRQKNNPMAIQSQFSCFYWCRDSCDILYKVCCCWPLG